MMKIRINRFEHGKDYTIGKLYINDNPEMFCFTLEDSVREMYNVPVAEWKIKDQTAIPIGSYSVVIDHSNRFQRDMPHIMGVSGFEGIRIHAGNTDQDTSGCILVGYTWAGTNWIGVSKKAFEDLFALMQKETEITLSIG